MVSAAKIKANGGKYSIKRRDLKSIRPNRTDLRNVAVNTKTAMTARANNDDRALCLASGMDDYISKPISSESLRRVLKLEPAMVFQ